MFLGKLCRLRGGGGPLCKVWGEGLWYAYDQETQEYQLVSIQASILDRLRLRVVALGCALAKTLSFEYH